MHIIMPKTRYHYRGPEPDWHVSKAFFGCEITIPLDLWRARYS